MSTMQRAASRRAIRGVGLGVALGAAVAWAACRRATSGVDNLRLLDRTCSRLRPIEQRLGLRGTDLTVEGRVATLHGTVDRDEQRAALEKAALAVRGVRGVESHLRVDGAEDADAAPPRRLAAVDRSPARGPLLSALTALAPAAMTDVAPTLSTEPVRHGAPAHAVV